MLNPKDTEQGSVSHENQAKAEIEQKTREYIKKQKKKMAVSIIILISVAVLMLTWKIYSIDSQKEFEKKQFSDQRVAEIQKNMKNEIQKETNAESASAKQQSIVSAIIKSQPLPVKIDDITAINNIYFKDNSLTFEVFIDGKKMKKEELDKMNNPQVIGDILQKNKPVACSIMKNLNSWEGSWTISYIYYFIESKKEIGRTSFSSSKCL